MGDELRAKLRAAQEAFLSERVRWLLGRSRHIAEVGKLSPGEIKELITSILEEEFERGRILSELKENGPLTVPELSDKTGLPKKKIMWHLICMMKDGRISIWGKKGDYYAFSATSRGPEARSIEVS